LKPLEKHEKKPENEADETSIYKDLSGLIDPQKHIGKRIPPERDRQQIIDQEHSMRHSGGYALYKALLQDKGVFFGET